MASEHAERVGAIEAEIRGPGSGANVNDGRTPEGSAPVHVQDVAGGAHTHVQGDFRPMRPGDRGEPRP